MPSVIEDDIAKMSEVITEIFKLAKLLKPSPSKDELQAAQTSMRKASDALKGLLDTLFKVQRAIAVTQKVGSRATRGLRTIEAMQSRHEGPTHQDWQDLSTAVKDIKAEVTFDNVVAHDLVGDLRELGEEAAEQFLVASVAPGAVRDFSLDQLTRTLTKVRAYEDVLFKQLSSLLVHFN